MRVITVFSVLIIALSGVDCKRVRGSFQNDSTNTISEEERQKDINALRRATGSDIEIMLSQNFAIWGGDEFASSDTYWTYALQFVEATSAGMEDWRIAQRYALACIFYATNRVRTAYTDSELFEGFVYDWLQKWPLGDHNNPARKDECSWIHVTCNDNGKVTMLNLAKNWLSGTFPPEVIILSNTLEVLNLEFNLLDNINDGELWWISRLDNLKVFNIGETGFQYDQGIPPFFGHLNNLTDLIIYSTFFQGSVNDTVFETMHSLEYLDMGALNLAGQLPTTLKDLSSLEFLYIDYAGFTGDMTDFIGDGRGFQNLKELWMDNNALGGNIPSEIGNIVSLQSFSATQCGLKGTLPQEVGFLTGMQQMWLHNNHLSGSIPTSIADMSNLKILELHSNGFWNQVPNEVCEQRLYNGLVSLTAPACYMCPTLSGTPCCTCCGADC